MVNSGRDASHGNLEMAYLTLLDPPRGVGHVP